jgi:cholestenol delta-isomerase
VVAGLIATSHPLRHALQTIVSLGQIYGDVLYYATCMFNLHHKGLNYSRPEAVYFWGYFVFINFIWIVIPGRKFWASLSQILTCDCVKPGTRLTAVSLSRSLV